MTTILGNTQPTWRTEEDDKANEDKTWGQDRYPMLTGSASSATTYKSQVTDINEWRLSKMKEGTSTPNGRAGEISQSKPDSGELFIDDEAQQADLSAWRILRAHFAQHILYDLTKLTETCGGPLAAVYANGVIKKVRSFRDQAPFEPFLEILMAFHDAMAFENRWAEYTSNQYGAASKILRDYVNRELDGPKIAKAIIKLEQIGFDTTPFAPSSI